MKDFEGKTVLQGLNNFSSVDVYNNILEKLSHGSGSEITCSLRLSAAAIMYLAGD